MRRKISLYIGGRLVEMNDQSFILFNYATEDFTNPTIVRNPFSRQITLPGTPANNNIFHHCGRLDSMVTEDFSPSRKIPFVIYDDCSRVLQRGYAKLDAVKNGDYLVTLYGELGAVLYGLAYDDNGDKRSLQSLNFGMGENDKDFVFEIKKEAVASAWKRLEQPSTDESSLYDIINFAPCYNGLPAALESNKAMYKGEEITLARKFQEWETRDLRSYLQRPCISVRGIFDALKRSGYKWELDERFFNASNPYYNDAWMLLPMLAVDSDKKKDGDQQVGKTSTASMDNIEVLEEVLMGGLVPFTGGSIVTDSNGIFDMSSFSAGDYVYAEIVAELNFHGVQFYGGSLTYTDADGNYRTTLIGCQLSARRGNQVVAESKVAVFGNSLVPGGKEMLSEVLSHFGSDSYFMGGDGGGDSVYLRIDKAFMLADPSCSFNIDVYAVDGSYDVGKNEFTIDWFGETIQSTIQLLIYGSAKVMSPSTIESGTTITKEMLLSNTCSPAEFLLSYCKQFGLMLQHTDDTISIMMRNTFYRNEEIDLTGRITGDRKVTPVAFTKKWHKLGLKVPETYLARMYDKSYGKTYGEIILDTGYEFNRETEDLFSSSVFKGGIACRDNGRAYYLYTDTDGNEVSPALTWGYTDAEGNNVTIPVTSAAFDSYKGYDEIVKMCGFDKESNEYKPVEISNALVFFNGMRETQATYWITDDPQKKNVWYLPTSNDAYATRTQMLPEFSRYKMIFDVITHSFDLATPMESYIPGVQQSITASIYTKFWQRYLVDQYDDDTKILSCKVNLAGLANPAELMRCIFWYDNCLWALHSVKNHSLTTYDLVECEFIRILNKENYTNGQS